MKLRNKKTGEIVEDSDLGKMLSQYEMSSFESISDLCEEWEDYTPKEPLIKDHKVRKAVRAWAEANDIRFGRRCNFKSSHSKRIVGWNSVGTTFTIEFDKDLKMYGDSITKDCYNIDELCGEEQQ